MWTVAFWKATAERAIRTVAQALLALWFVGDEITNAFTWDWSEALGISLGAAVLSVLTALIGSGLNQRGTPSITSAETLGASRG